ncbi:uncharacterized protein LOC141863662 [Acropora palmata]|uniref:uncharacterized protein LOC141863662 n=1 Tax=Acropora palmata TaxID=6131 RepID=UPI003DA11548
MKIALMRRYDLTEDGYRRKFRISTPETDGSPDQFIVRLSTYLIRWLELSKTEKTFEGLKDFIVKEQFINSCPKELAAHLRERGPETLEEMAKIADQYLDAHGKHVLSPTLQILVPNLVPHCKSCDICQKTVNKGSVPKVPLQKMPLIDMPFKWVAIDRIGPVSPSSEAGHRYILTLVDYATRYPEAVPLKNIDTETVAEALVDIFRRLGIPQEILSDLGTQFVSDCMKEVARLLSIKQLTTTPYHPMCNGLTEKFNGTLKTTLKRLCSEQPRLWHRYINPLLFAYREVAQESTGFSPFELLYGRAVRGPMFILKELWTKELEVPEVKNSYQYVFELREKLEDTLKIAHEELQKAQQKGKHYYDRKTKVRKFQPGDKVLVLLPTDHNKLLMQWKGPYEVSAVVGINDYKVRVKDKLKVYNANLLKAYIEREEELEDATATIAEGLVTGVIRSDETNELELDSDEDDNGFLEIGGYVAKESVADVMTGPGLSDTERAEFLDLAQEFSSLLTEAPGTMNLVQHHINLTSSEPVRSKPYPVPYSMRESLKKDIECMMKMGVIRESNSPYASPVVVVKKKDGSNRVCVDYRKLNKLTVFDPEPMPAAVDLFQKLNGDKFFSKVDLSKGYWQVTVPEVDIPKTAFVTRDGSYEFLKMPSGMVNSAATLKRGMKKFLLGRYPGPHPYMGGAPQDPWRAV